MHSRAPSSSHARPSPSSHAKPPSKTHLLLPITSIQIISFSISDRHISPLVHIPAQIPGLPDPPPIFIFPITQAQSSYASSPISPFHLTTSSPPQPISRTSIPCTRLPISPLLSLRPSSSIQPISSQAPSSSPGADLSVTIPLSRQPALSFISYQPAQNPLHHSSSCPRPQIPLKPSRCNPSSPPSGSHHHHLHSQNPLRQRPHSHGTLEKERKPFA
ncbi:hypothetical protein MRB53_001978 [Persea americana]|uniref:Uncharacterized protein n=1 Tax=Persea americana TaxID=3435 RepID=A0ACC2MT96_PERAE|nr:hypothetical protein MRB53_001978 [Persea americana]